MEKHNIQVGRTLEDASAGFIDAWKQAERGNSPPVTDRISFIDWAALCSVLTPKRYELLRYVRQTPATGVRSLARALKRDVKRVHDDVVALAELGLLTRHDDGSLSTSVDEISSTIRIAA